MYVGVDGLLWCTITFGSIVCFNFCRHGNELILPEFQMDFFAHSLHHNPNPLKEIKDKVCVSNIVHHLAYTMNVTSSLRWVWTFSLSELFIGVLSFTYTLHMKYKLSAYNYESIIVSEGHVKGKCFSSCTAFVCPNKEAVISFLVFQLHK